MPLSLSRRLGVRVGVGALHAAAQPTARRFAQALNRPEQAQAQVLRSLLQHAAPTAYGRYYGITGNESYGQFAARLPVVSYADLAPWLSHQRRCERRILCPDRVLFYETTSGSGGAAKLIPYTAALRQAFQAMFQIWMADVFQHGPAFRTGRVYICISPTTAGSTTAGSTTEQGRPLQLNDDADYLAGVFSRLVSPFLIRPEGVRQATDTATFHWRLARALLAEEHLEIISIWNPHFLLSLLAYIGQERRRLATAVPLSPLRQSALLAPGEPRWQGLWPDLKWISCWRDAAAAAPAQRLAATFPNVPVQGKGLLATEAPITVPMVQPQASLPLVDQVFLEGEDEGGTVRPLEDFRLGERFQVVVSTPGGLLRYRLGDEVEVVGGVGATRGLRFLGKVGDVADMVGEKLTETFVREQLRHVPAAATAILVPVCGNSPHYELLLGRVQDLPRGLGTQVDALLAASHHYRLARHQGQLGPVAVRQVTDLEKRFLAWYQSRGVRLGDIKARSLIPEPLGPEVFAKAFPATVTAQGSPTKDLARAASVRSEWYDPGVSHMERP